MRMFATIMNMYKQLTQRKVAKIDDIQDLDALHLGMEPCKN